MPGGREKVDCQMPGGREFFLCKCLGVSRGGMVRVGIEQDITVLILKDLSHTFITVVSVQSYWAFGNSEE